MEMEDQYNMSDLRQLMNGGGRTHFPSIPLQAATELFPTHRPPPLTSPQAHHQQAHHHPYEQLMMMSRHQAHEIIPRGLHHHHEFRSPDSSSGGAACNNSITAAPCLSGGGGLEGEAGGCVGGEGSGRWPRQETLTLLEIRSRLDFKFKEANQKGPLWDEVSRIMGEEHGYQRSGKKCREKFENLYKYYKKTKEGKAGRQDGKHYRFFRQLEALYGETTNTAPSLPDQTHFIGNNNNSLHYQTANNSQLPNQDTTPYHNQSHNKHCDSLSLSNNSSEFDTSSSEDQDINDVSPTGAMDDDSLEITKTAMRKRRGGGRGSWKAKIKDFIDAQMRKLMDKQEEWLERLMRTLEQKEKERMVREEDWRKQEVERVEREHKFWAKERAWIEARDKALMEALHKLTDHQEKGNNNNNNNISSSSPDDHDDDDHHQNSTAKDQLLLNKKRKENVNSRSSACYFQNNDQSCSSLYSSGQGAAYCGEMSEQQQGGNDQHGSSTSPCGQDANVGNAVQVVHDNCFPFLMSEGENLWENYGLKLSKGSQNQ